MILRKNHFFSQRNMCDGNPEVGTANTSKEFRLIIKVVGENHTAKRGVRCKTHNIYVSLYLVSYVGAQILLHCNPKSVSILI